MINSRILNEYVLFLFYKKYNKFFGRLKILVIIVSDLPKKNLIIETFSCNTDLFCIDLFLLNEHFQILFSFNLFIEISLLYLNNTKTIVQLK